MYEIYKVFLFMCTLKHVNAYASGTYDCPSPWIGYLDNCYRFMLFPSIVTEAIKDCAVDQSTLVRPSTNDENNFIIDWLTSNAKDGTEWFTDGIRDVNSGGGSGSVKYIWQSDGTEVTGQQFWFSIPARTKPGNRIVYYTDGSTWGWSMFNDTINARPYICQISKQYIYRIVTVDRGFDYGVDEIDPVNLPHGPSFTNQPQDVVFDPASSIQTISMECEADANPLPTYQWMVTRQLTTQPVDVTDSAITITNGRLSITKPQDTKHNGNYQCIARNLIGPILSDFAQLSFGYLNDFPKSQRDAVVATSFTGIGIECLPPKTGYTVLSYAWFKDTFHNFIRPNVKWYSFVSSDGKLYFQFVTKDDAGEYFCIVTRPDTGDNFQEGKISMAIPLQITETVGSDQEPQIVNSFPKSFPTSPLVGNDVRIECIAWGTSVTQMSYSWNRTDGNAMPTGANFSDYNRVMSISNIQLAHAGRYRCSVSRQLGQSTFGDISLTVEAAPFFTIPLENQNVDLNSTVKWRCMANGVPAVTYQWYMNATLLNTTNLITADRARITVNNNILTINNVQFKDAGMYQCSVTNTHGTMLSSAQLRVLSFAPTFDKFPLQPNTYGTQEGNVTLVCNPESSPSSTKVWYKDGNPLNPSTDPASRVLMLPNGNLQITLLSDADMGNYTCEATNLLGVASSSGQITVLPTTTITQPPRDTVVMVNQTAFFYCQASYNPAIDLTYDWYHNSYKIMFIKVRNLGNTVYVFTEPSYTRGTGINRGGLYINQTQFYHAGTYTCVVKSTSQQISFSARLTVMGPPGEPAGITGNNVMATNITLTWWPGRDNGRPITSYIVEGYNLLEGFWRRLATDIPPSADQLTQVVTTLTNLNPYTQYQFRAIGVNALGEGVPSKSSPIYRTGQAPPITYPLNLRGGGGKVGTLNMTWDPMPVSEQNADAASVGYVIYWKRYDMNDDQWDKKQINNSKVTRFTVTVGPNNYYILYNIKVQAFNPMGYGPMSPQVDIMSAEDLPKGVPISVRAVYSNATAIIVEWLPVNNTREVMRGVLAGYRINYWIDGEQQEQNALFKIIHNQTSTGLILGLRENTYYQINVQAINTAGNGPKSENYRTRTLRAAPKEAPQQVTVTIVDHQSVLLHWRGVYTTIEEEPLEGYIVRYWKRGENIYVANNVDAGKKIRFVLGGLEQYIQYQLRVYGYSRGGDGLQSSPTVEFILAPDCAINEDSPDKQYIYSCNGDVSGSRPLLASTPLFSSLLVSSLVLLLSRLVSSS